MRLAAGLRRPAGWPGKTLPRTGLTKRKAKPKPPEFRVWLKPAVHNARKRLPGRIRQRMKRLFVSLWKRPTL